MGSPAAPRYAWTTWSEGLSSTPSGTPTATRPRPLVSSDSRGHSSTRASRNMVWDRWTSAEDESRPTARQQESGRDQPDEPRKARHGNEEECLREDEIEP